MDLAGRQAASLCFYSCCRSARPAVMPRPAEKCGHDWSAMPLRDAGWSVATWVCSRRGVGGTWQERRLDRGRAWASISVWAAPSCERPGPTVARPDRWVHTSHPALGVMVLGGHCHGPLLQAGIAAGRKGLLKKCGPGHCGQMWAQSSAPAYDDRMPAPRPGWREHRRAFSMLWATAAR